MAALLCSAAVAGCVAAQGGPVASVGSGGFQMVVDTPTDWQPEPAPPGSHVFVCKPLACRYPAVLNVDTTPNPTRSPDPAALQRTGVDQLRALAAEANASKIRPEDGATHHEFVRGEAGSVNGYPALMGEYTKVVDGKTRVLLIDVLYVGPLRVYLKAASPDREQARKGLDLLVRSVSFRNVPA